ncbi:hypothetical protein Q8A67_024498 [Cirrhinus molitorella]|uniref:Uncharacterized protein n=1 Tax=Cirrhinus molitorella TaxID=172907 RepID=A0AA88T9H5_9TELE|nr:hypothetical protein Q8A67_024498 [Cirrhinus molitorella]
MKEEKRESKAFLQCPIELKKNTDAEVSEHEEIKDEERERRGSMASTFAGAYYPGGGLIIFSHQKLQEMAGDGSALDSPVVSARVTLSSPLLRRSPLASLFLEISPDAPIAPSLSSSGPPDLFKRPALRHLWRLTPQRRAHD